MSQISYFWNITMVSYEDTSPELANTRRYRNLIRLSPSEADANLARLQLLRRFGWTKTSSLYYQDPDGHGSKAAKMAAASADLSDLLESQGFNMADISSARFMSMDSAVEALKKIKAKQYRIISTFVSELNHLAILYCAAHRTGLVGSRHVWIVSGLRQLKPAETRIACPADSSGCNCSAEQLGLAANRSLFVSLAGWHASQMASRGVPVEVAFAMDSVSAVAEAARTLLVRSESSVQPDRSQRPISKPVLNRLRSLELMRRMMKLNFSGKTGIVKFSKVHRLGSLSLYQLLVASNDSQSKFNFVSEFDCATRRFKQLDEYTGWPDNWPPKDRTQVEVQVVRLQLWLRLIFIGLAGAGISLCAALMSVNCRYRQHPYIKMSSPQMNNVIVLGCIVCYASLILLATDGSGLSWAIETDQLLSRICAARAWTLCIGFTLSFGAMLSKTWRVHYIFTNISMSKKIIKDYQLLLIVLLLLLIDIGILILWTLLDPMSSKKQLVGIKNLSSDRETHFYNEVCTSQRLTLWIGVLFAYKGLLLLIGCFFAWETRSVSIPALNDSKYIGLSVYNALVMCVAGAAVSFALKEKQTSAFVITSLLIFSCTSITLLLLFSPKLIEIRRDPRGEARRARATLLRGGASAGVARRRQQQQLERDPQQQQLQYQKLRRGRHQSPAGMCRNNFFGLNMARALDENRQLNLKLDAPRNETSTAAAAVATDAQCRRRIQRCRLV